MYSLEAQEQKHALLLAKGLYIKFGLGGCRKQKNTRLTTGGWGV